MEPDSFQAKVLEQLAETRRHFDVVAESLRSDITNGLDEAKRHSDIVAEGLRDDIRLLAEGIGGVNSRLDRVEREMADGFTDVKSMIRLSYTQLDRRLQFLEDSVADLRTRVEKIEKAA